MNHDTKNPANAIDALHATRSLLLPEYVTVLQTKPLVEALWTLHMTLGHTLRAKLNLWGDHKQTLFDDLMARFSWAFAVDGDTASSTLIEAMWREAHSQDTSPILEFKGD